LEELTSNLIAGSFKVTLTIKSLNIIQIIAWSVYNSVDSNEKVQKVRCQQIITFFHTITWSISVSAVCIAILMILSALGVDLTPLLARVGIA